MTWTVHHAGAPAGAVQACARCGHVLEDFSGPLPQVEAGKDPNLPWWPAGAPIGTDGNATLDMGTWGDPAGWPAWVECRPQVPDNRPSVCRMVHYVDLGTRECLAAVVTRLTSDWPGLVDLTAFGSPAMGLPPAFAEMHVPYADDEERRPRTWHWPERVP